MLGGADGPAAFVIAGDGFEMLAGPPDIEKILDAHPQFTDAVAGFAAGTRPPRGRPVGQPRRPAGLGLRRHRCSAGATGRRAVRPGLQPGGGAPTTGPSGSGWSTATSPTPTTPSRIPGHRWTPRSATTWSATSCPRWSPARAPGSLLEGVQWLDGDIADFIGSRLFYRKIVGKLWLVAVPFVAILLLRLLTFLPGVHGLLHHHAQRWLLGFGLLVAFIIVVAAVAAAATLLRVNRALRETAVSGRSDPASHNAPPRAEAARLVTKGYAGMISGHTHEPELSVVGTGFYANTGSGTASVVGRPSRLRLPHPFVTVHRFSYVEIQGGAVLEREAVAARGAGPVAGPAGAGGPGPEQGGHVHHRGGRCPAQRPDLAPRRRRGSGGWVVRRRVRRVAAGVLLLSGVLNVVFAALWHITGTRPVDHWLPFGVHPLSGGGGHGGRTGPAGPGPGHPPGPPAGVGGHHRAVPGHARPTAWSRADRPRGPPSDCCSPCGCSSSTSISGSSPPGSPGCSSGWPRPAWWSSPPPPASATCWAPGTVSHFDVVFLLVVVVVLVRCCWWPLPGRESRRTGAAREEAFDRARGIIEHHGGDTLDYFALRDDKSWFFTGESLVAYSVINGVMLVSPDPIGPPAGPGRGVVGRHGHGPVQQLAALGAGRLAVVAAGLPGGGPGRPLHRRRGHRRRQPVHPQGQVDEVPAGRLQPDEEGRLPGRVLRLDRRRPGRAQGPSCSS